ncbi:hypothetical protein B0H21DRAFT_877076 [Amylocystis lapponica]|nr:hypothetical protein B0H21DRAFT_877076 [Amylocystis lapponica]
MPNPSAHGPLRKTLAIKHSDGEPLTRADLQYDFLHYIFSDTHAVFTDPYPTLHGNPARSRVTFRDLYLNTLLHSPRCSKASREKIIDTPAFGDEFAKISILSNVGRINTTMAFFPEMRTALRTYHPIPSLQKTDGNLQDAPRIKNILKSCFLENEAQGVFATPAEVLSRSRCGQVPPTSIVNLMFVFASHAGAVARAHFHPHTSIDFLDFFTPVNISSASRARAFLWLCYHYHEAPSYNPFADDYANRNTGQIPQLVILAVQDAALENVDPPEEVEWGERMMHQRRLFVETKAREDEEDKEFDREKTKPRGNAARNKLKAKSMDAPEPSGIFRQAGLPTRDGHISLPPMLPGEELLDGPGPILQPPLPPLYPLRPRSSLPYLLSVPRSPQRARSPDHYGHRTRSPDLYGHRTRSPDPYTHHRSTVDPYPRRPPSPTLAPTNGKPTRTRTRPPGEVIPQHRYNPLPLVSQTYFANPFPSPGYDVPQYVVPPPVAPRRNMLEQAWHVVMTGDPLGDSDDETLDENSRLDYVLRLRIISRLRGKSPTPEPVSPPPRQDRPCRLL